MATLSYPNGDNKYITISLTSQPLTIGQKTFDVPDNNLDWKKGDLVYLYWRTDGRYNLKGKIVSYTKTPTPQLVIDITDIFYPEEADPNQNLSPWDISNIRNSAYGNTTGLDLTSQINLNNNPLDIEEYDGLTAGVIALKWNLFIDWINNKTRPDGTKNSIYYEIQNIAINTNANQKTNAMINDFNQYLQSIKPPFIQKLINENKRWQLNQLDVKKVQIFHNKTDSNVQIDSGFIGTQTIRLKYPSISPPNFFRIEIRRDTGKSLPINFSSERYDILIFYYGGNTGQEIAERYIKANFPTTFKTYYESYPPATVIPLIWGDKRFIITQSDYERERVTNVNLFKSYDLSPNLYNNFMPWKLIPPKAAELLNLPLNKIFPFYSTRDGISPDLFMYGTGPSKNPWTSLDSNVVIINQTRLNDATRDYYDNVISRSSQTTDIINSIIR